MTYYTKIHFLEDPEYSESEDYDWKNILATSYNEALSLIWEENEIFYDEEEENERYYDFFEELWSKDVWWNWIYYFSIKINFDWINEEQIDEFQELFFWQLKDKTSFLWKFEDSRFVEIRKEFFEEIFKIEMNLREVISFIFFNTYFINLDLLKDLQVNPVKKDLQSEEMIKNLENEFFYISFSDYKNLLNLKNLKDNEKTKLLEESDSFDEWKNKIFNRWVQEQFYVDFITSIKQDLDNLEKFRNAIMHNRWFSKSLNQNYDSSKYEITSKIDNFKKNHMYLELHDIDLIPWKKYTYIAETNNNFIKWEKYDLLETFWWDTIFRWEKDIVHFFDKEFLNYWKD